MRGQMDRAKLDGVRAAHMAIVREWAAQHTALDNAATNDERAVIEAKFAGIAVANLAVCEELEAAAK